MAGQVYGNGCSNWAGAAGARWFAAAALLCAGCDGTAPPPSKPPPTARAVDAAIQSAESYLAAQKPREAAQVAARLAADAPGLMRTQELHARTLVTLAQEPFNTPAESSALWGQAADAYDRAAALEPKLAALQHAAGVVSDTAGRAPAARAHYQTAHDLEPANAQYTLYLGLSLARAGEVDSAQALLLAAERASPASPDAKAALADLALRRNDTASARDYIAKARALQPASLELRLADARIRRLDKHPEQSLDLLLALDHPVRCQPGIAEEIALAHTALGDYPAAANALEASATAKPDDWSRAVRVAKAWQLAGDPVKAQVWLQHALGAGAPPDALNGAGSDSAR